MNLPHWYLVFIGWLVLAFGIAAAICAAIYVACRLIDIAIARAGMTGLMLKFCKAEFEKEPRAIAARMFWGAKEPEDRV